jgi:hypothetical protein
MKFIIGLLAIALIITIIVVIATALFQRRYISDVKSN